MTATPLPPLPPAFGVSDNDVRPGGRSMLDMLTEDHHTLRQLCDRLVDSPAADVEDVLIATLSRHLSAEEQYLYPTIRKILPDGGTLADREVAADADLLRALQTLHGTARHDDHYGALVEKVTAHIHEHATRTGQQVFPRLQAECSDSELIRLGNRVQIARESAPTRPHPSTPLTPPLNKVVDPAVGVVDKVRDALSRRTTWPEDL